MCMWYIMVCQCMMVLIKLVSDEEIRWMIEHGYKWSCQGAPSIPDEGNLSKHLRLHEVDSSEASRNNCWQGHYW